MRAKQWTLAALLVLVILLGGALALLTGANRRAEEAADAAAEGSIPLASFSAEQLTCLEYTYDGETIVLEYDGETWNLTDDPEYRLDQTLCDSMAAALCDFKAKRHLEAQEGEDYGLSEPVLTVEVTAGGETFAFAFGSENSITGDVYLQKEGDASIYTASSAKASCFEYTKADLFEPFNPAGLISSALEKIEYTVTEDDSRYTVSLQKVSLPAEETEEGETSYTTAWRLVSEPDTPLDDTAINALISSLTGYVSAQTTGADLAAYGLDAPQVTVTVTTDESEIQLAYTTAEDGCYLAVEGDASVYQVDPSVLNALCRTAEDLKAQEE